MSRIHFSKRASGRIGTAPDFGSPLRFHRRLPGYTPTPLHRLPDLAARLGIGAVLVKDESSRLGLPAFKVLGASYAVYHLACSMLDEEPHWRDLGELRAAFALLLPLTLVTATDGNHGRAVARVAHWFGFGAQIFVPAGTVPARISGIESEGAHVTVVDGSYDDAVDRAKAEASERCLVVSDTSWPGYSDVPAWVADGYSTIMHEIDAELAARGEPAPDLVFAQVGVGALAVAVVKHARSSWDNARIISVEPEAAACALESAIAGASVSVTTGATIMAGLNCGTLSEIAWPVLRDGADCFLAIGDERAREGVRLLAAHGIVSGETGASGMGALIDLLEGEHANEARARLDISASTRALVISTEGATDPEMYRAIVARA